MSSASISPHIIEQLKPLLELDINILLLVVFVYISVGVFFVEGTYEIIKVVLSKVFNIKPDVEKKIAVFEQQRDEVLARAEAATDMELEMMYKDVARKILRDIEQLIHRKADDNWMDVIIPASIGMISVFLFYPNTIFSWLPFAMVNFPVELIVTGVIFYRGSNLAHGGGNKVGSLFESLIGRISGVRF
ncbi:MAG: hypothetical protein WCS33_00755 [Candidatus Caldatribacteriota bacterium]|jgi:hypothetical protein